MNNQGKYKVFVIDKSKSRQALLHDSLKKEGFSVSLVPHAEAVLEQKLGSSGRIHILMLVVDRAEIIRPEQTEYFIKLSFDLALHADQARRAMVISGSPNNISKRALRLSAFYRIIEDATGTEPATVEIATRTAKELRSLDGAAKHFLATLSTSQEVRTLLGTAVSLIDNQFRIWHMDAVHVAMTGGGPVEGQICWHAYHGSEHQIGPCQGCAVAETFRSGKARAPRVIASQVEKEMRFFQVASQPVHIDSGAKLVAEFASDITDTPRVNCMEGEKTLKLLMRAITSYGFARARAWEVKDNSFTISTSAGYSRRKKVEGRTWDLRFDPYSVNALMIAKKPQIYSEADLGKEKLREPLGKQNVKWWMEFPFFDRSGQPIGVLAVDNEDEGRDKKIQQLLEVQQVANRVEAIMRQTSWLPAQEKIMREKLEALRGVGYEQASLWDLFDDELQTIRGRLSLGSGEEIRAARTSLYCERFLYEAGALHRIPRIFDRIELVEGSEKCKDYLADAAQVLVFPLFRQGGSLVGFLIVSNPGFGKDLGHEDIARLQPFTESLGLLLEETQSFLERFSQRAMPLLCTPEMLKASRGLSTDPCLLAANILVDELKYETSSSHLVVRALHGDQLKVLMQRGFSAPVPATVDVSDKHARCAGALRLGFPDIRNNLESDQEFQAFCRNSMLSDKNVAEFMALRSMIAEPIRDTLGILGTIELFSDKHDSYFVPHKQQDWVQSIARRLAYVLRIMSRQAIISSSVKVQ